MNDHLLYLAKIVLNEQPTNGKLNAEISHTRNATLVLVFPEKAKPLLLQYLHGDGLHGVEQHLIAKFLKLLTYDCAIDVILPYTISDRLRKYIKAYKKDTCLVDHTNELISLLKKFSLELASLLMFQEKFYSKPSENLILFIEYLNDRVISMHQNKIAPAPAQPQLNSYNPGKYGIAYYFNWGDKKLRENCLFTVDEKGGSQNFDDRPANVCNKYFPQVSKRGSTYLLCFCGSVRCMAIIMVSI